MFSRQSRRQLVCSRPTRACTSCGAGAATHQGQVIGVGMIEAKCQCGASLDVPESFVAQAATCGVCGGVLNFVAAEPLAEGAGGGDFDARLIVTAGPMRAG